MKDPQVNHLKTFSSNRMSARIHAVIAILLLQANLAQAIEPASSTAPVQAAASQTAASAPLQTAQTTSIPFDQMLHTSRNPFDTYRGKTAPSPSMTNSARLDSLVRDGKLYLSLRDAIDLALENNLDLVIARFNLPIAQMDILRTKAGGFSRGVNTGVVSGTPGGMVRAAAAALARAAPPAARVAPVRAVRASFSRHWEPAPRSPATTPTSRQWPTRTTPRNCLPTGRFTACLSTT